MQITDNEMWLRFLESPLAILEDHGLEIRVISALEKQFGLYVKNMQCAQVDDLLQLNNIGPRAVRKITTALNSLWERCNDEV